MVEPESLKVLTISVLVNTILLTIDGDVLDLKRCEYIPKNLHNDVYHVFFNKFIWNGATEQPIRRFRKINKKIIDLFLYWWDENTTSLTVLTFFSIQNFYLSCDFYKTDMIKYLFLNKNRWLGFLRARSLLLHKDDLSFTRKFFSPQEFNGIDQRILTLTFRGSYIDDYKKYITQHLANCQSEFERILLKIYFNEFLCNLLKDLY